MIAVLTLTQDNRRLAEETIRSLQEQTGEWRHFVVDRGSGDGLYGWLEHEQKEGRLYWLRECGSGIRLPEALNVGVEAILRDGGYAQIAILEPDVTLDAPDVLARCAAAAADAVVAPKEGTSWSSPEVVGGQTVRETKTVPPGLIVTPSRFWDGFRLDIDNPDWAGFLSHVARDRGCLVGMVDGTRIGRPEQPVGWLSGIAAKLGRHAETTRP